MTGLSVLSTYQDYTDPVWLGSLGQVSGWQHTVEWPGGCTRAQFSFNTPVDRDHPALTQGRLLRAYQGTSLRWTGRLEQPDTTQIPWSCTATGIAAFSRDYIAYSAHTGVNNPYDTNYAVDFAVAIGLPWIRNSTLLVPPGGTSDSNGAITLADELNVIVSQGNWWQVDVNGVITTGTTQPSNLAYRISPRDPPGRTLGNYVNYVIVVYIDSLDHVRHTQRVSAPADVVQKFGSIAKVVDLTSVGTGGSSGEMAGTVALAAAQAVLDRYLSQGVAWAGGFQLGRGQAFTINGTPLTDLGEIQPGVTVRVDNVTTPGQVSTDVLIGQVDYDADSDTVTLTPYTSQKDDLITALGHVA